MKLVYLVLILGFALTARAEDAVNVEAANAAISSAVDALSPMVGSLAMIGAGVVVYRKVKHYFETTDGGSSSEDQDEKDWWASMDGDH